MTSCWEEELRRLGTEGQVGLRVGFWAVGMTFTRPGRREGCKGLKAEAPRGVTGLQLGNKSGLGKQPRGSAPRVRDGPCRLAHGGGRRPGAWAWGPFLFRPKEGGIKQLEKHSCRVRAAGEIRALVECGAKAGQSRVRTRLPGRVETPLGDAVLRELASLWGNGARGWGTRGWGHRAGSTAVCFQSKRAFYVKPTEELQVRG